MIDYLKLTIIGLLSGGLGGLVGGGSDAIIVPFLVSLGEGFQSKLSSSSGFYSALILDFFLIR